jgi:hypothetical protein
MGITLGGSGGHCELGGGEGTGVDLFVINLATGTGGGDGRLSSQALQGRRTLLSI